MHWTIATIAVETGIAPQHLLDLEPRMLWTIERYMIARAQNQQKQARHRRR